MKPTRILFPTDFSPSATAAFRHALYQAEVYGAELHILHSIHWDEQGPFHGLPEPEVILKEMRQVVAVKMAELRQTPSEKPLQIIEATQIGPNPTRVILDYIQEHQIGMVVMGTHGRVGVTHFLLGSVAEEIARLAPCPVFTVRDRGCKVDLHPIRQVLVPVDYSIQAKHALHLARAYAATHNAHLHILFVVHEFECGFGNTQGGLATLNGLLPQIVAQQKLNLSDFYRDMPGERVPHSLEVEVGVAAPRIVEFAKRHDIDTIIMGTHGFGGFNHLILGSTTERVIRMAPCPVLSMKVRT